MKASVLEVKQPTRVGFIVRCVLRTPVIYTEAVSRAVPNAAGRCDLSENTLFDLPIFSPMCVFGYRMQKDVWRLAQIEVLPIARLRQFVPGFVDQRNEILKSCT